MALSIFFAAFLICSLLVFFLSVYGAKEVTFEENLKATGQTGKSQKKSSKGQDTKKKNAKKLALAKGPDTSEIVSESTYVFLQVLFVFLVKLPNDAKICDLLEKTLCVLTRFLSN